MSTIDDKSGPVVLRKNCRIGTHSVIMPGADAIVMLSGGRVTAPGDPPVSEWNDAGRFFGGIALFQAGESPLLVFTDGWSPWQPDMPSQGRTMQQHALDMGVPPENLRVTDQVVNTTAEAVAVARMLPASARVLLVTSAYHMRRSTLLFERENLEVIPFPVDFQVETEKKWTFLDLMPQFKTGSDPGKEYSNHMSLPKRAWIFLRHAFNSVLLALRIDYDLVFATTTPLTAGIPGIIARYLRNKPFVFEVRDL